MFAEKVLSTRLGEMTAELSILCRRSLLPRPMPDGVRNQLEKGGTKEAFQKRWHQEFIRQFADGSTGETPARALPVYKFTERAAVD